MEILEIKIHHQKSKPVLNIRMEGTEKTIWKVEYRTIDITQSEQQRGK